jgi:hypothetical protein
MDALSLAEALVERTEIREFIAKNIDSGSLLSIAALASHLPRFLGYRSVEEGRNSMQPLYDNREDLFLGFWEEFVHPVLKDPGNQPWAEKWRGGHITNEAE